MSHKIFRVNESYRLRKIAKLASSCKNIIDVGFAQQANPYLANDLIIGVDPNAAFRPKNYHQIYKGSLEDYKKNNIEVINCIIAGELIEHLENPIGFLKTCRDCLTPGGKLILSTPNPNSIIERILTINLSRKYFYTKEHIFIFPQRWLIRLLEISGFGGIKLYSGGFPIPIIGTIPFPRPWCHQTIALATTWRAQCKN